MEFYVRRILIKIIANFNPDNRLRCHPFMTLVELQLGYVVTLAVKVHTVSVEERRIRSFVW